MWNFRIQIRYPMHMDVLMLELQQWFEGLEIISNELGSLIIIHIINNTMTNFERENGEGSW
jgi:hypothetical protein